MRVPFDEVVSLLAAILVDRGCEPSRAARCALLFAETTRDGVYSHGVNRFPRFLLTIDSGTVDLNAEPRPAAGYGSLQRWDGRHGPGNLNAQAAMAEAIDLAKKYGIGAIALSHTNHWMRGGSYGWQAAIAGVIGICWTNTMPNLPAWGGTEPVLGNNPLVIAVPRADGPLVLDMAMSQFSYGALAAYRKRGELLPVDGGFDAAGEPTRDPALIEQSKRALPIGYWKGSSLSLLLDAAAVTLSGGIPVFQINGTAAREGDLSQFFLALDPAFVGLGHSDAADLIVNAVRASGAAGAVRYPGEKALKLRAENMAQGLPIDDDLWKSLEQMSRKNSESC